MYPIRIVLFDALHTLVKPRLPIPVQYSQVFEPYLGKLPADQIANSFKHALKYLQQSKPLYKHEDGVQGWWGEVVKHTALKSGADPTSLQKALPQITTTLMQRFSSQEGYMLFDDVLPTIQQLKAMNIRLGVISNSDVRMRAVLEDLGIARLMDVVVISEEMGVEKPDAEVWKQTLRKMHYESELDKVLHIGDSLDDDYQGAISAGLRALLLCREGLSTTPAKVSYIASLAEVIHHVQKAR